MAARSHARAAYIAGGVVLAAALLYYSLREIDWREVAAILRRADPVRLGLITVLATGTLFLRACRWRILLTAGGAVPVASAFWATAAGYFGNNFLPARAGELIRTYMISARTPLSAAFVLATALSERIADAVALLIITATALLALPELPGWLADAGTPVAVAGLAGGAAIAFLPLLESPLRRGVLRLAPHSVAERLASAMEHGLRGLRAFHDPRRLAGFAALTVAIWCLDALGSVLAAAALGLTMSLPVAFLLIAGLSVGSALPSTPGYIGIYQFVAVSILTPFGFGRADAIAFILVAQVVMYAVIGFWGSLGLVRYRRARM